MSTHRWSRDVVTQEIRRLHEEGADLRHSEVSQFQQRLVSAAIRYYGSWGSAVMAAGIDYITIRKQSQKARSAKVTKWSTESISREIRRLMDAGENLAAATVRKNHPALFSAAVSPRYYGSWRSAVTSQGIDYNTILSGSRSPSNRPRDARGMRTVLRRLAVLADDIRDMSADQVRTRYPRLFEKAETHFGTWQAATEAVVTHNRRASNGKSFSF